MNEKVLNEARELIAGFLRERREELGMTQPELAERTGLGLNTIKRMEDAKFWPGLKQYLIVCEALHLFPVLSSGEFSRMMRQTWTRKEEKDIRINSPSS